MTIGSRHVLSMSSLEGMRAEVDDRGYEQRVLAAGRLAGGEQHMLIPDSEGQRLLAIGRSVERVLAIGRSAEGEQHMLIPRSVEHR